MAPNATATKPGKIPEQLARPRPAGAVWLHYHPWMEGLVGHLAAWGLHLLVIGAALLVVLAYSLGFFKQQPPLPVEPVTLVDAGSGNPQGKGDEPKANAPLPEAVGNNNHDPNKSADPADRSLPADFAKVAPEVFTPNDARIVEASPDVASVFYGLEKHVISDVRQGVNPRHGTPGPDGPGTGKLELNQREKRMLRWSMKFTTRSGEDYLEQLRGLGAILAIPVGPNQFKIVDLAKGPPYQMEDRDLSTIQRIWWIDNNPTSVQSLMGAMRLPGLPARVIAFIPPELEADLTQKELAFKGLKDEEIFETKFEVYKDGDGYKVRVVDQAKKQ